MIIEKEILNRHEFDNIITRLAFQIIEKSHDLSETCIIGIKRRGAILADRIQKKILKYKNIDLKVGYLDITLYRDDLSEISDYPILSGTQIECDIQDKNIILIDDVIFTGRTVRAALDAIIDFGRPKKIIFAVLVDKGHRELPIQPDFTGKYVPTSKTEVINVCMEELDGKDTVAITKNKEA